jgi:hypothetical protein
MRNEVRQVVESYAGQRLTSDENCLHVVLTGVLGSGLDAPSEFNKMSALQRARIARDALARAGVVDLAPAAGRALDHAYRSPTAAPRCSHDSLFGHVCGPSGITEEPANSKFSAEDAAVFRGLLKRPKARKRRPEQDRRDNQVASDSEALADAAAQTVRNGAEGFRSGDLADAETELQPIPEQLADLTEERLRKGDLTAAFSDPYALGLASSDLERKREIEEYRADVGAQERIVARESSPHDLAPPPSAAIKSPLRRPDLQDQPRRLPVDEDLEHERTMAARRQDIAALSRQVVREGGPRPDSHGLSGHPPSTAAYDRAPVSDLEYFKGAAAATCGGRP